MSLLAYRITIEVVLVAVVLGSVYSIYRWRRQRPLESIPMFEAEKTGGSRPSSRQFLINGTDLESGPEVEGEDNRNSFLWPPMTTAENSRPTMPPLAFDDARLVHQPEAPLALLPPRPSLTNLPAQPSAALLSNSHIRKVSDTATLAHGSSGAHGVAYHHDSDGFASVRSSLTSSILPPSYHCRYPDPENSQTSSVVSLNHSPTAGEDGLQGEGEGVEEAGTGRPSRRTFDGGVRLAGGRPDEGDSGISGGDEVSVMPPAYHDL